MPQRGQAGQRGDGPLDAATTGLNGVGGVVWPRLCCGAMVMKREEEVGSIHSDISPKKSGKKKKKKGNGE